MKKIVIVALIITLVISSVALFAQGGAEAGANKTYSVRMPTGESEGDFMTVWAKNFATHMAEKTDGRWNIEVFPYGTLGENDDIVELAQNGVVEFVFADYGWLSSYVPQTNTLALHYIWPKDNVPAILEWVNKNGKFMAMMEEKYREKDLVPLGIYYEGWQWLTSKKPINELSDLVGLKTRIMASNMLSRDYRAYGIDPTPMSYGEIYSGLQTGLLDAQSQPMFANYSMGFYEVADFFVQLWAEPFIGIPCVNKGFFDSLTEADQKLIRGYWKGVVAESAVWIQAQNDKLQKEIATKRPSISFKELNPSEVAQLKTLAETKVYPDFPSIGGPDSAKMLEVLRKDVADAQKALGL
ncbi:MAG: C4-dicarboxylate ABC transporter substrate-binding protein [Spirochaetia bacterium]|nr:C4-dicarboxylate ABC transporter substrate-binding protein [Spirochaetia bacterium]